MFWQFGFSWNIIKLFKKTRALKLNLHTVYTLCWSPPPPSLRLQFLLAAVQLICPSLSALKTNTGFKHSAFTERAASGKNNIWNRMSFWSYLLMTDRRKTTLVSHSLAFCAYPLSGAGSVGILNPEATRTFQLCFWRGPGPPRPLPEGSVALQIMAQLIFVFVFFALLFALMLASSV